MSNYQLYPLIYIVSVIIVYAQFSYMERTSDGMLQGDEVIKLCGVLVPIFNTIIALFIVACAFRYAVDYLINRSKLLYELFTLSFYFQYNQGLGLMRFWDRALLWRNVKTYPLKGDELKGIRVGNWSIRYISNWGK